MEPVSLQKILTSISGDRLLLKQWWTISLMAFIHREDARCLWRARKRRQEGQLTSCIVTLIIICHVEHVHTTAEGATAARMDSCWASFSGNTITEVQHQQVAAWDLGHLFWPSVEANPQASCYAVVMGNPTGGYSDPVVGCKLLLVQHNHTWALLAVLIYPGNRHIFSLKNTEQSWYNHRFLQSAPCDNAFHPSWEQRFQPSHTSPPPALSRASPGAVFQVPCRKLLICSRGSNTAKWIS